MQGVGGDFQSFGVGPIQDAPYQLVVAFGEALTLLTWYKEFPKDEIPPRWIWWSGDLIEEWFEEVRKRREEKSSSRKKGSTYSGATEVPMMGNQLLEKASDRDARSVPV